MTAPRVWARAGLPFVDGRQACARAAPELFFYADDERGPSKRARDEAAKAVCATCPLTRGCLAHALTHAEWGTWGGMTEDERADLQARHGLPRKARSYQGTNDSTVTHATSEEA
ncbi:WhiB family transcriptional regulator [Cellulomonas sp. P4]|uniref:WhiB family transcriptional regulator n=1 Tax=Cellulomonas sp. P4 TaxID=3142533 RepID=UPI0031BAC129